MSAVVVGALAAAVAVVAVGVAVAFPDPSPRRVPWSHPDAPALADVGWRTGLGRWEALRGAFLLAAVVVAASTGGPLAIGLGAALVPSIWVRLRAEAARDRARRGFSRILATTEAAIRSGLALPDALRRGVAASGDPLASGPVAGAVRAFDLGASLDGALIAAAEGCRDDRARAALRSLALGIAERLPRERQADLIGSVVDRLSFEERLDDEVRARASGARMQQRILAALVPGLAVYLALTMPTLASALGSDLGRFVLIPAAVSLEVAGIVLGRHVLRAIPR